jgi:hypothetical protein
MRDARRWFRSLTRACFRMISRFVSLPGAECFVLAPGLHPFVAPTERTVQSATKAQNGSFLAMGH